MVVVVEVMVAVMMVVVEVMVLVMVLVVEVMVVVMVVIVVVEGMMVHSAAQTEFTSAPRQVKMLTRGVTPTQTRRKLGVILEDNPCLRRRNATIS